MLATKNLSAVCLPLLLSFAWSSASFTMGADVSPQHKLNSTKIRPSAAKLKAIDNLINSSKFADAALASKQLLKRFPNSAELNADLALASLYKGDQKTAQTFAEKALKLDSQNHEAHWVLTNVYSAQGKVEESMRELRLSMTYRSQKPCKPCQKNSKQNLELLKSIQQRL